MLYPCDSGNLSPLILSHATNPLIPEDGETTLIYAFYAKLFHPSFSHIHIAFFGGGLSRTRKHFNEPIYLWLSFMPRSESVSVPDSTFTSGVAIDWRFASASSVIYWVSFFILKHFFVCLTWKRKIGEHSLSKSVRLVRCSNVDWISLSFSTRANLVRGKKKSKYDSVECPSGNLLYQKRKCYSGRFRISTENGIELASRRANLSSIQCACAFQPLSARVCGRDFHVDVL